MIEPNPFRFAVAGISFTDKPSPPVRVEDIIPVPCPAGRIDTNELAEVELRAETMGGDVHAEGLTTERSSFQGGMRGEWMRWTLQAVWTGDTVAKICLLCKTDV